MLRRNFVIGSLAAPTLLSLESCGSSSLVTDLNLIVTAADIAVGVLGNAGVIPPDQVQLIETYLSQVTTFVDFAAGELASTDSAAVKAAKIANEASSVIVQQLPPGLPSVIAQVVSAVTKFLSTVTATQASLQTPYANAFFTSKKIKADLSDKDKKKLAEIREHNRKVKAKIHKH